MSLAACLGFACCLAGGPGSGGAIPLAHDGRASMRVVAPADADPLVVQAADDLRDYLGKVTGADFSKSSGAGEIVILDAPPADAPRELSESTEAVWIDVRNGRIRIAGGGPAGAAYGTYRFLEKYAGVRWFLPGPDGEYVPRVPSLNVEAGSEVSVPAFEMRWVGSGLWGLRNGSNRRDIGPGITTGNPSGRGYRLEPAIYHTQEEFLPLARYYDSHPEYYALVKGKRADSGDRTKLCTANPQVIAAVARNMGAYLDAHPGVRELSLSPTDGTGFCECPLCIAQDEPGAGKWQKLSRRMVLFYNAVTRSLRVTHPGVRVAVGAYHVYTWPPAEPSLGLLDGMDVILCHYSPACLAHPVCDPDCPANRDYLRLLGAWQARSSGIIFYEYYWKNNWLGLPWPIVHSIADDIPRYRSMGVRGLYTQYTADNGYVNGLNYYVAAKLLWDPSTDVRSLVTDFVTKYYAEAAVPMQKYWDRLEARMMAAASDIPGEASANALKVFDPAFLDELEVLLNSAQSLAPRGSAASRRVARHQIHLRYSRILLDGFLRKRAGDTAGLIAAYEEALRFVKDHAEALQGVLSPVDSGEYIRRRIERARAAQRPRAGDTTANSARAARSLANDGPLYRPRSETGSRVLRQAPRPEPVE